MKLLVTDLDNTLYDWVTFFAHSFSAMLDELTRLLGVNRELLLDEFKAIHQRYGTSEPPFALTELPSVAAAMPGASPREMLANLEPALEAFSKQRREHLRPYEGVTETLAELQRRGITVIGHTEAIAVNAHYRLGKLGLLPFFTRLYASAGPYPSHPNPDRTWQPPDKLIRFIPQEERKPNPQVLLDVCREEGIPQRETWYVGDSLTKDVGMALAAGVTAIWARYGTKYDANLWKTLVRVTHWTAADVEREERLRQAVSEIRPDYIIDSFGAISALLDVGH